MKKRNNGLVIFIFVLLIIACLGCGTIGLLADKNKGKETEKEETENKNYQVTYRYYLDGNAVGEMIKQEYLENNDPEFEGAQTKTAKYAFEKYDCTKGVKGTWDEEKWEFVPELTANTTCRLYFIKNIHNMTVKVNNGKLPNNETEQKYDIEINKDMTIKIVPTEGYVYDKTSGVNCTNNAKAEFNEETNDLKISNVTKDNTVCSIGFKISDLKVEVRAANGSVETDSKTISYGGTVTVKVTPSDNYTFDSVNCTNGQTGTYNIGNQTLTVTGVTKDTVCNVQFRPLKYKVTLEIANGTLINGYNSPQEVNEGGTATFGITNM